MITAEIASADTSLVQEAMQVFISRGIRDRLSAFACAFPGQYLILNLKSASSPTHRCPVALSFADVNTYVKGLSSVQTTNGGE